MAVEGVTDEPSFLTLALTVVPSVTAESIIAVNTERILIRMFSPFL